MANELTGTYDWVSPERWVARFSALPVPVLRQTIVRLEELKRQEESVRPDELSQTVLHDPMLTLRVLRFLREHRTSRMVTDITTIEHAIMMLGVSRFFSAFADLRPVDELLGTDAAALDGLMGVVARARHAALHARAWAEIRHDVESDEVIIATLLHDMAEMLLWCFAPEFAKEIQDRLRIGHASRSADAQKEVLGFRLNRLQLCLTETWDLPPLLTSLMNDHRVERPRALNVILAVDLARHAANGWEDAALPHDLVAIQRLTGRSLFEVRRQVFLTALEAARDQAWYGDRPPAAWLPPFPIRFEIAPEIATPGPHRSQPVVEEVIRLFGEHADDQLFDGLRVGPGGRREGSAMLPSLVALAMLGCYKGLGVRRLVFYVTDADTGLARARFLGGAAVSALLAELALPVKSPDVPFVQQLIDTGSVWWQGTGGDTRCPTLPGAWAMAATESGFYAARIDFGGRFSGVLYADDPDGGLDEARFAAFREMASRLESCLQAPMVETSR